MFCAICGGPIRDMSSLIRDTEDEGDGYDPEVISRADVAWLETCHLLIADDPDLTGTDEKYDVRYKYVPSPQSSIVLTPSSMFITGPGTSDPDGRVSCQANSDPMNGPPVGCSRVYCYASDPSSDYAAFPFHWPCYELLAVAFTGSSDTTVV